MDISNGILSRKSNFFTLFIELTFCVDTLPKIEKMKLKREEFEGYILEGKVSHNEYYFKYYTSMLQGTNHRSNRVFRAEYVKRLIQEALD